MSHLCVQVPQLSQQFLALVQQMELAPALPPGQAQLREEQTTVLERRNRSSALHSLTLLTRHTTKKPPKLHQLKLDEL